MASELHTVTASEHGKEAIGTILDNQVVQHRGRKTDTSPSLTPTAAPAASQQHLWIAGGKSSSCQQRPIHRNDDMQHDRTLAAKQQRPWPHQDSACGYSFWLTFSGWLKPCMTQPVAVPSGKRFVLRVLDVSACRVLAAAAGVPCHLRDPLQDMQPLCGGRSWLS